MITGEFKIKNPTGLHARPASQLCKLAREFQSEIAITCGEKKINPCSIISILKGELTQGKTIQVTVDGEDEQNAMDALTEFLYNLQE